jgi:hypothetical protein
MEERRAMRLLSDQGIATVQGAKSRKIAISGPQFPHAVKSAQRGHARVMNLWAGDPAVASGT